MLYKFDDIVNYQIEFYYNNQNNILDFIKLNNGYANFNNNTTIFKYNREILTNQYHKKNVENIIKSLRKTREVYLTTTTTTPCIYQFHPFVNIHIHWNGLLIENNIIGDGNSTVLAWPPEIYNHDNRLVFDKDIKSILSVRRKTHFRDILFSKISSDVDCIFRYHQYTNQFNKSIESYVKTINEPPSWQKLCDEHNNSIFCFVVETDNGDDIYINSQISEKTLNSFLNGNIPIVLGQRNFIKELKNLGLYVWNDEFGFDDADSSDNYEYRIDKFINCYNNVKNLTFNDSKLFWNDNLDKIQKNYDIISNLITKRWKPLPTNLI